MPLALQQGLNVVCLPQGQAALPGGDREVAGGGKDGFWHGAIGWMVVMLACPVGSGRGPPVMPHTGKLLFLVCTRSRVNEPG